MNCKQGDLAYIVYSICPENIGAVVEVLRPSSSNGLPAGEMRELGITWNVPNSNGFAWIVLSTGRPLLTNTGLALQVRPFDDRNLRPITPPPGTVTDEEVRKLFSPDRVTA